MSKQTAQFRLTIDAAKAGNEAALRLCRTMLDETVNGDGTPPDVILELSECVLRLGIEQGRRDAETN